MSVSISNQFSLLYSSFFSSVKIILMFRKKVMALFLALFITTHAFLLLIPQRVSAGSINEDITIYNKLVGFGRYCGLDGGPHGQLSKQDVDYVFDDDADDYPDAAWRGGTHGDLEDAGDSIVVGFSELPTTNGYTHCSEVMGQVMDVLLDQRSELLKKNTDQASKDKAAKIDAIPALSNELGTNILVLFLTKGDDPTLDLLFNGGVGSSDVVNPWRTSSVLNVIDGGIWGRFVENWVKPAEAVYSTLADKITNHGIASRLEGMLNTCFSWYNAPSGSDAFARSPTGDLPGLYATWAFNDAPPGWDTDFDPDNEVGKEYNADEPGSAWFTYGYIASHHIEGSADENSKNRGILSCNDLSRPENTARFLPYLEHVQPDKIRVIDPDADAPDGGVVTPPEDVGDDADVGNGCELNADPLSWIICPILNILRKGIEAFSTLIQGLLFTDLDKDFTTGGEFYQSWSVFRYISLSIIIVAAIVMVVGQATSGIFDAYSVKKIMPKLVASVVMIALSWVGATLVIDITNTVALNLRSIFLLPFGGIDAVGQQVFDLGGLSLAATGAIGVGVGVGAVAGLGVMGLLSMAITGFLAMLVGLVVLTFRKMLVIVLVITSPIAIACSVLPNTQKVWKLWSDSFIKVLMMFPLIMLLITAGQLLAVVTIKSSEGINLLNNFIAFAGYFGPYFLIPATFKFAGSAFSTIAGAANNRSKGVFDRQRNWRNNIKTQRGNEKKLRNYENAQREGGGLRNRFVRGRARIATRTDLMGQGISPAILTTNQRRKDRVTALEATGAIKAQSQAAEEAGAAMDLFQKTHSRSDYLAELSRRSKSGDNAQVQAAIKRMTQQRAIPELEEAQQYLASNGQASSWNEAMTANFSDLKSTSPHLVTEVTNGMTAGEIASEHAKSFAKASDEVLAGVGKDGWAKYVSLNPNEATTRAADVMGNDKLKAGMANDARDLLTAVQHVGTQTAPQTRNDVNTMGGVSAMSTDDLKTLRDALGGNRGGDHDVLHGEINTELGSRP